MKCIKCQETILDNSKFCNFCGEEQDKITAETYKKSFGFWKVTTEDDEEGRRTRQLGTFEGYVHEIALQLADKVNYRLEFEAVRPPNKPTATISKKKSVPISFAIESQTWRMSEGDRIKYFRKLMEGTNVSVEKCNYHACVTLVFDEKK